MIKKKVAVKREEICQHNTLDLKCKKYMFKITENNLVALRPDAPVLCC